MLSKEKDVFQKYAMDCGFYTRKGQGLFSKITRRRGIF